MYDGFFVDRDFAEEWESGSRKLADMASHLREARELASTLGGETLRLRGEIEDERKKTAAAKAEAKAAVGRCDRAVDDG